MKRRDFIKLTAFGVVTASVSTVPLHGEQTTQKSKPNIVFILSDDQARNGLSVQMHPEVPGSKNDFFRTPNLEKLARQVPAPIAPKTVK